MTLSINMALLSPRVCWEKFNQIGLSKTRRLLVASGVLIIILLLRLRVHHKSFNLHGFAADVHHEDECVEAYVKELEQHLPEKLVPLGKHTKTGVDMLPSWAGTGNGQLMFDATGRELFLQSAEGLARVPWAPLVPVSYSIDGRQVGPLNDHEAVTFVDVSSVLVRQFIRVPNAHCTVLERMWYTHKIHHNLLAEDFVLHHSGPGSVSVSLVQAPLPAARPEDNMAPFRVAAGEIDENNFAVVIVAPGDLNLTARNLHPGRATASTIVNTTALRDRKEEDEKWESTAIKNAQLAALEIVNSPEPFLNSHEAAWERAREGVKVHVEGLGALDQIVPLAHHYFSSGLGLLKPFTADKDKTCGCFSAAPKRTLDIWRLPARALAMDTFVDGVHETLLQGCCDIQSEHEMQQTQQALAQSVAGIEITGGLLRIAPSWDLPPKARILVSGVHLGLYRVRVELQSTGVTVAREDHLSRPLFAIGGDDEQTTLGQKPVSFPAETVYVAGNPHTLKHAKRHEHTKVRPDEHPRSRLPRWLVGAMIVAIVLFHCALLRLIYQEYCR